MAQRVQVLLVDDITGEEVKDDGSTVNFAVDGVEYEIDLNEKNLGKFRESMKFYTDHGRRTGGRKQRGTVGSSAGGSTKTDPSQLAAIREWGRGNGYKVSDRGRVSQEIKDAFEAAHKS